MEMRKEGQVWLCFFENGNLIVPNFPSYHVPAVGDTTGVQDGDGKPLKVRIKSREFFTMDKGEEQRMLRVELQVSSLGVD